MKSQAELVSPTRRTRAVRRVLLASYHFPPSKAVGARRPARLARLLPQHGFEVDVICGLSEEDPSPNDGAQSELGSKTARVIRIPCRYALGRNPTRPPPAEGFSFRNAWWKARAYVEWLLLTADWSWRWGRDAARWLDGQASLPTYDVLILNAPPRAAVAPFVEWAARREIPIVVDLRDVWASEVESWPWWWPLSPRFRRKRWFLRLRDFVLGSADHVVANTREAMEAMRERLPDSGETGFSWIPNGYESYDEVTENGPSRSVHRLVHTGSLGYGRYGQAGCLIEALGVIKQRGGPYVELVHAGNRGEDLIEVARNAGVADRVHVHQWLDQADVVSLQRDASALVLFQTSQFAVNIAVPAKLFEYMARRKPILAMVGDGPAGRIVRHAGLGVAEHSTDPVQVADAIERLIERVRARPILPPPPARFSERRTVEEFARILEKVVHERSTARI